MKIDTTPEIRDTHRVTLTFEIDATIGELRAAEAEANRLMGETIAGVVKGTHTPEQAEEAIQARADAGVRLHFATAHAQAASFTAQAVAEFRRQLEAARADPVGAWLGMQRRGRG